MTRKRQKLRLGLIKETAEQVETPENILKEVKDVRDLRDIKVLREYVSRCLDIIKEFPAENDADTIKDAEVFVSVAEVQHGVASYNSALPTEVAEAKSNESASLGLRIVFQDGRISTEAARSVFTTEALQSLMEWARKGAVFDPDFVGLPVPIKGEEPSQKLLAYDKRIMRFGSTEIVNLTYRVVRGALNVYKEALGNGTFCLAEEIIPLGPGIPPLKEKYTAISISGGVTAVKEMWALKSTTGIEAFDIHTFLTGSVTTGWEKASPKRQFGLEDESKGRSRGAATRLADFKPEEIGAMAARKALEFSGGKRIESGRYSIILSPQAFAETMTYVGGPSLSVLMHEFKDTIFPIEQIGKQVISENLSFSDDPTIDGSPFSRRLTSEGLLTKKTPLVKGGKLVGYISDTYYANKFREQFREYGIEPIPRNGFREDDGVIDAGPSPRATFTNLSITGEKAVPLEEMISGIKAGKKAIFVSDLWYTYPTHVGREGINYPWGSLTSSCPTSACLIEKKDGKIVKTLLKPNSFRLFMTLRDVLLNVKEVSAERELIIGWAASNGILAPYIKIDNVEIVEVAEFLDE